MPVGIAQKLLFFGRQALALRVDNALRIADDDIVDWHTYLRIEIDTAQQAGNSSACCPRPAHHYLHIRQFAAQHSSGVEQRCQQNYSSAVLVVVEYGNAQIL